MNCFYQRQFSFVFYPTIAFFCSLTEKQFLSENNNDDDDSDDDEEEIVNVEGKTKNENIESSLMAKLQSDVKADEETHKLDGKATKNQKTEKKEFRRKVIDYVLEKLPGLQSRSRRAGLVHNFLRGLGLNVSQGMSSNRQRFIHFFS